MTIIRQGSGEPFNYLDISSNKTSAEVVARALSKVCRFSGHCREFVSVAQHAVLVSYLVHPSIAMLGLHHDDAEAFIGDINSPLKQLLNGKCAGFIGTLETSIMDWLYDFFGIPFPSIQQTIKVHHADLLAYSIEKKIFMNVTVPIGEPESIEPPIVDIELFDTLLTRIGYRSGWIPDIAYDRYMQRWEEIKRVAPNA